MSVSSDALEKEALRLPRQDKARLVRHLLESMEVQAVAPPQEVERAWLAEANRRYEAYLRGDEQAITAEQVFAELRDDNF